jgi:hypothetical protein
MATGGRSMSIVVSCRNMPRCSDGRLAASFEATQKLLDGFCDRFREKVNESRL